MFENPLLPHRKLQELYRLMERTRTLERKNKHGATAREALLASTAIHLEPGDMVSAPANDLTANNLAPVTPAFLASSHTPRVSRLVLSAASSRGLQAAGNKGLVLAYSVAGTMEPAWEDTLAWAQTERLPFVLAVTDATGGRSSSKSLNWQNADRVCRKLKVPTLTVDGEDAVAVFRVMQEATLRARTAAGPAVIWAMLTPSADALARSAQPIARLKRYMTARKIPLS